MARRRHESVLWAVWIVTAYCRCSRFRRLSSGVSRRIVQHRGIGKLHVVSGGLLRQHHCVEHVQLQWSVSSGPVRRDGGTDELELLGRVSSGVLLSDRVGERDSADVCRGPVQRVGLGIVCELLGGTVRERVGADERKLQWPMSRWTILSTWSCGGKH